MKEEPAAPGTRRALRTKEKILDSALQEFSRYGFDGARVDRIAKRAGTNKERLYAYIGGKEKLFSAALQRVYGLLVEEDAELLFLGEEDLEGLTEKLVDRYFAFHEKHPEFRRLLAWANLMEGGYESHIHGMRRETFDHLSALYRKGQARGVFSSDVSARAYLFVVSAVTYFYYSNLKTMSQTLGTDLSGEDVRREMQGEILRMLEGKKKPPRPRRLV